MWGYWGSGSRNVVTAVWIRSVDEQRITENSVDRAPRVIGHRDESEVARPRGGRHLLDRVPAVAVRRVAVDRAGDVLERHQVEGIAGAGSVELVASVAHLGRQPRETQRRVDRALLAAGDLLEEQTAPDRQGVQLLDVLARARRGDHRAAEELERDGVELAHESVREPRRGDARRAGLEREDQRVAAQRVAHAPGRIGRDGERHAVDGLQPASRRPAHLDAQRGLRAVQRLAERVAELARFVEEQRLLAQMPTLALGLTKRALHAALDSDLEGALELERALQGIASKSHDYGEGVKAFQEKRKPRFTGR